MLRDNVRVAVPAPGTVGVDSTLALAAATPGCQPFLGAFAAGDSAYFALSDGAGRALRGIWTVNANGTATITSILHNDRLNNTAGETFSSSCVAYCFPAAAHGVTKLTAAPMSNATAGAVGQVSNITAATAVLPAGGTWEYDLLSFNASGAFVGNRVSGVAAGGTTIGAASAGITHYARIKRIA